MKGKANQDGHGTGWREVTVGMIMELLPKEDQLAVERIFRGGGDIEENIKKLRDIYVRNRTVLESHGYNPEFIAYATAYAAYRLKVKGSHKH